MSRCAAARRLWPVLAATLCLAPWPHGAQAQAPDAAAAAAVEIQALLDVLPASGCEFERNGAWHAGAQAREHLARKHQQLARIKPSHTTEDFIGHAASSSSMTGRAYRVRCPGADAVPAGAWLQAELRRLRSGRR